MQQTLRKSYSFEGKGLHTGKVAKMAICPAPVDTGILFIRTDIGPDAAVEALAENVSNTARSTTISKGEASVSTIEHLLSALTGMGVDNAIIRIDNVEVPI
ncbi:MAG: UDP-3-O-acyl-N-acetylglucosamine deacetylase, partial [Bacteroidales bacterium]|nr:UDP-3-O-acyl-N-acetylglucosamine deacetylase [Bacteroidales bacterium]